MYVQEIESLHNEAFYFFKCSIVWEAELYVVLQVQSPVTAYRKITFREWASEIGNIAEEAFPPKVNQQKQAS